MALPRLRGKHARPEALEVADRSRRGTSEIGSAQHSGRHPDLVRAAPPLRPDI